MKAILSFCPDLTAPDAKCVEIGVLTLQDDKFSKFEWTCDRSKLGLSGFASEILKTTPDVLRAEVNKDWPEWKRRELQSYDPQNAAEYVAMCRRHSSIFVSRIENESRNESGGAS